MDSKVLIAEAIWFLATLMVVFLAATIILVTGVIAWSEDDLLWFVPLCAGIAYGGRIGAWAIKRRTESTRLTEAIKTIIRFQAQ